MADERIKITGEINIDSNLADIDKEITRITSRLTKANLTASQLTDTIAELVRLQNIKNEKAELEAIAVERKRVEAEYRTKVLSDMGVQYGNKKGTKYTAKQLKTVDLYDYEKDLIDELAKDRVKKGQTSSGYIRSDDILRLLQGVKNKPVSDKKADTDYIDNIVQQIQKKALKDLVSQVTYEFKVDEADLRELPKSQKTKQYTKDIIRRIKLDDIQKEQVQQEAQRRLEGYSIRDLAERYLPKEELSKFLDNISAKSSTESLQIWTKNFQEIQKVLPSLGKLGEQVIEIAKKLTEIPRTRGEKSNSYSINPKDVPKPEVSSLALQLARQQMFNSGVDYKGKEKEMLLALAKDIEYKLLLQGQGKDSKEARVGNKINPEKAVLRETNFTAFMDEKGNIIPGTRVVLIKDENGNERSERISNKSLKIQAPGRLENKNKELQSLLSSNGVFNETDLSYSSISNLAKAYEVLIKNKNKNPEAEKLAKNIFEVISEAFSNTSDTYFKEKFLEMLRSTPFYEESDSSKKEVDRIEAEVSGEKKVYARRGSLYTALRKLPNIQRQMQVNDEVIFDESRPLNSQENSERLNREQVVKNVRKDIENTLSKIKDADKYTIEIFEGILKFFSPVEFNGSELENLIKNTNEEEFKEIILLTVSQLWEELGKIYEDPSQIAQAIIGETTTTTKTLGDIQRDVFLNVGEEAHLQHNIEQGLETTISPKTGGDSFTINLGDQPVFDEKIEGIEYILETYQDLLNLIITFMGLEIPGDSRENLNKILDLFKEFAVDSTIFEEIDSSKFLSVIDTIKNIGETTTGEGEKFKKNFLKNLEQESNLPQEIRTLPSKTENLTTKTDVTKELLSEVFQNFLKNKAGKETDVKPLDDDYTTDSTKKTTNVNSIKNALNRSIQMAESSLDALDNSTLRYIGIFEQLSKRIKFLADIDFPELDNIGKNSVSMSSQYNALANLMNYEELVDISNKRYVDEVNKRAGKEILTLEDRTEQWKSSNPESAKKYELSKLVRDTFLLNGGWVDIKNALQEVFKIEDPQIQSIAKYYNNLGQEQEYTITYKDENGKEKTDKIVERAADIFEARLYARMDRRREEENPDKTQGQNYYRREKITGEQIPYQIDGHGLSYSEISKLKYQAGYTGYRYGGTTIEENLTNANLELQSLLKKKAQFEQIDWVKLSEAEFKTKELEYTKLEAEIGQIEKDIKTLKNAQNPINSGKEKTQQYAPSKVSGVVDFKKAPPRDLRQEEKDESSKIAHEVAEEQKAKLEKSLEEILPKNLVKKVHHSSDSDLPIIGKEKIDNQSELTDSVKNTTQALSKESEVLESENKIIGIHANGFQEAIQAELNKKDVSLELTKALNKEKQAINEVNDSIQKHFESLEKLNEVYEGLGGNISTGTTNPLQGSTSNTQGGQVNSRSFNKNTPNTVKVSRLPIFFDAETHTYTNTSGNEVMSSTKFRDILLGKDRTSIKSQEDIKRIKDASNSLNRQLNATDVGMSQSDFDFYTKNVIGSALYGDYFHAIIDNFAKTGQVDLNTLKKETETELAKYNINPDEFLGNIEANVKAYLEAYEKIGKVLGLTLSQFSEMPLGARLETANGIYEIAGTLDQLLIDQNGGGAFIDNKTGKVHGYEAFQLTFQKILALANQDWLNQNGIIKDSEGNAVNVDFNKVTSGYIAKIENGVVTYIENKLLELEEFADLIDRASRTKEGKANPLNSNEVNALMNRQLATGRFQGGTNVEDIIVSNNKENNEKIVSKAIQDRLKYYKEFLNAEKELYKWQQKAQTLGDDATDEQKQAYGDKIKYLEQLRDIAREILNETDFTSKDGKWYANGEEISEEDYKNYQRESRRINLQYQNNKSSIDITEAKARSKGTNSFNVSSSKNAQAIKNLIKQQKDLANYEKGLQQAELNYPQLNSAGQREMLKTIDYYKKRINELQNSGLKFDKEKGSIITDDGEELLLNAQEIREIETQIGDIENKKQNDIAKQNIKYKEQRGILTQIVDSFKNEFRNLFDYRIGNEIINAFQNGVRRVIDLTKELNSNMVDLQIASGESYSNIYELSKSFNDLGRELGRSTSDVMTAANDWLRAGYNAQKAAELTRASMELSTLGMINSADATSYLISTMKGWKLEASEVGSVVDKFTAIDFQAAVSAGDLAEAISRSSVSAQKAGLDLDTFLGYVTVVQETTQKSAEVVGSSFQTLFSRYQNAASNKFSATQEEIESGDYDEENYSNINDIETALKAVGINIRDTVDHFRDFDEIIQEIASRWDTFSNVQQAGVATSLAG